MKWASWVTFGLGLWLVFAPITFGYASVKAALHEDLVFGIVIAALGLWWALRAVSNSPSSQLRRWPDRVLSLLVGGSEGTRPRSG
jgi:cytochrome c oxidase assembly factor CtaG